MLSKLVRLALPAMAVLAWPCFASAQPAQSASTSAPTQAAAGHATQPQAPAYVPPVVQFDPKGLSLLEAVRLTLQHDPNVKLRETDVQRQAGAFREQRGYFDGVFKGSGSFQYSRTELRDTQMRDEQTKRDQLDLGIAQGRAMVASLNPAIDNLNSLKSNPGQTTVADLTRGVADQDVRTELGMIQGQVQLINDLISRTADQTVKNDLISLRTKTIDESLTRFNAAKVTVNQGIDRAVELRTNLGDTPQDRFDRSSNVRLDFQKPLRSGIVVTPYFDFNYTSANYVGKNTWDPNYGGLGVKDFYKAEVGFDLSVPLMRGRGSEDTAASERAAERDLEAARLNLLHEHARSVLNTTLAYWEARAATELVDVAKRSVDMQTELADLIRKLVAAQEKARTDETRVTASLADAQARYEAAQRRLSEARINLARVMGVAVADAGSIPLAGDPFPRPTAISVDPAAVAELARQALAARPDQLAALESEKAARLLARGASLETRPALDLSVSGWGNSTAEDSPKWDRWVFRSGSIGLDLELPMGNNLLRGRADQAAASLNQASITQTDLGRTIALSVYRAAESVRLAAERVKWAEEAALAYEKTIQDEQARLRLGDSTLIDTILTEQQTTAARTAFIQALQDYANLVVRLRFESGTLVRNVDGQASVPLENLMTVPLTLQKASAPKR